LPKPYSSLIYLLELAISVASGPKGRSHLVFDPLVILLAILQCVALDIEKFSKAVKF
jgi:hypothetical protein